MNNRFISIRLGLRRSIATVALLLFTASAHAEIPTVLSDDIKGGGGTIDLMQDVTSAELAGALSGGTLLLGADLNETSSAPESATSQGVAIKEAELLLTTTEGTFSFNTFYTNTTAMLTEQGTTEAAEYHTMFGQTGSNELTSSTEGFDLSTFDDVLEVRDIEYSGEILSAELSITFLDTDAKAGETEQFFDYSAGFEDFAILAAEDAQILDNADLGLAEAPSTITYTTSEPSGGSLAAPSGGDLAAPSGAPEPHWFLLGAMSALLIPRLRRKAAAAHKT